MARFESGIWIIHYILPLLRHLHHLNLLHETQCPQAVVQWSALNVETSILVNWSK